MDESRISQDYDSEPLKDYITTQQTATYETESKLKIDNSMSPILPIKNEVNIEEKIKFELIATKTEAVINDLLKSEKLEIDDVCKSEAPMDVSDSKSESFEMKCETPELEKIIHENEKNHQDNVNKSDVDMENQNNDDDIETDEFSSPTIVIRESEANLKQRVANIRLEFNSSNVIQKIDDTKCEVEKMDDKSDVEFDFDEFDVEAQMKKITGDDGDDYKEKVDTSSEKDKSMDGLEGLMDSSKEDSDSDEKDVEDFKKSPKQETVEERAFKVNISLFFQIKMFFI